LLDGFLLNLLPRWRHVVGLFVEVRSLRWSVCGCQRSQVLDNRVGF
jgi:hypothetical protein